MTKAAVVLALVTLRWDDSLRLVHGVTDTRPGDHFRRRMEQHKGCFLAPQGAHFRRAHAKKPPSPPSSLTRAPWGMRRRVRPCARQRYSERNLESEPHVESSKVGACVPPAETAVIMTQAVSSASAGKIGSLALPLGANRPSRITTVKVDNLAMVDSVSIELGRGLVAITGETGAGKSLVSSAFSLAAGARVRGADLVGSKGSTAKVQLEMELADDHRVYTTEALDRLGIPLTDGGRRLTVTRTVGGKGSSASVNGCPVKVGALRDLMSPLIYTVDANAFELFSRADSRLRALDRMLSPAEGVLADEVRRVVGNLKRAEACRARLEERCRFEGGVGGDEDTSLLRHWVEELDEFKAGEVAFMNKIRAVADAFVYDWGEDMLGPLAEPLLWNTRSGKKQDIDEGISGGCNGCAGEDEGLEELWPRLKRIHEGMQDLEASRTKVELARQLAVDKTNPESISHVVNKIRGLLIDAEDENVGLSQALLEETHEDLNFLEDSVKRAGEKLQQSVDSLPRLPITLEEVEERTVKWRDLSRKHGVPPERLGSMQAQLRVELDELVVAAEALPLAREKEAQWRSLAEQAANELSAVRRRAAVEVEQLINPMMADVGLEGASIQVLVEESKMLGPAGADRVQFLLEANQGQTRGTVDAVASSGEKSRLLLLLETRLPPPVAARSGAERKRPTGPGDGIGNGDSSENGLVEGAFNSGDVETVFARMGGGGGGTGAAFRVAPCAVLYDEIDAHVGGRTAVAVGRLLANQGRDSQVVVVTHTASVAALADQHLLVDKVNTDLPTTAAAAAAAAEVSDERSPSALWSRRHEVSGGGLSVSIREVRGREREKEVARMAAGDMGGGAAAELAREMLRYSQRKT